MRALGGEGGEVLREWMDGGVWVCDENPGPDLRLWGCAWWEAREKVRDGFGELAPAGQAGVGVEGGFGEGAGGLAGEAGGGD